MLTVHHLGKSQSERIVWLCEELEIAYELKHYARAPVMAPEEYRALHPIGSAPVITDGDVTLAESGAVVDWIIAKHGDGRLSVPKDDPAFADYLYWFHFANGTLQPAFMRLMVSGRFNPPEDHPALRLGQQRMQRILGLMETRLSKVPYLAGEFSAADIMTVFSLTTMRHFQPYDLSPWPCIQQYLVRISARPAYQRAMLKGDPGMDLLLG
ncbi:glutathione S-transferase family protein [Ferrovibrio terrae]|uniref:glutathione transferase n=1 Tax=Ferrovibrio terrae TaxID=2594003 RepID=A0A516GX91_9PROT|nr:glutathione S-transferase family protein [Ferrovibrio terrae]QDO96112.1 glutathione S-transferase family protein [Ferrovibrio terrae]